MGSLPMRWPRRDWTRGSSICSSRSRPLAVERSGRTDRVGRHDQRQRRRPLSVSCGGTRLDPRGGPAADVPLLGICLGANSWPRPWGPPSTAMPSRRSAGIKSSSCPPRRRTGLFCEPVGPRNRLSLARRDVRFAGRRRPPGAKPACRQQAFRYGPRGLWPAIPRGDGARLDGTLVAGVRRRRDSCDAAA